MNLKKFNNVFQCYVIFAVPIIASTKYTPPNKIVQ